MPDSDLPEPDSTRLHDLLDRFLQAHPEGVEADLDAWASGQPELASEPELVARLRGLLDERRRGEALLGGLMPPEHRPDEVSFFRRRSGRDEPAATPGGPPRCGQPDRSLRARQLPREPRRGAPVRRCTRTERAMIGEEG